MESANSPALLLLDLPASSLAGIDLLSFTVTPRFRGVKDLPPGLHFAFAGTSTAFSERHGLWFRIASKLESSSETPLFITKWDPSEETLVVEQDEAERLRRRANLGSIWREGLTPYRQTSSSSATEAQEEVIDWPTLTSNITAALLRRITGGDSSHWHLTSASSAKQDLEHIPGLDSSESEALQADRELNFLPINLKQTWREGATGRERTEAAQDRSWALEHTVAKYCTDGEMNEVQGEMQFCFLMILTLNNFSCLEQWKRIIGIVFTCRRAVAENSDFFIKAIAALRLQLQHCKDAEGGLIDLADNGEGGSLLKSLLVRFRKGLESVTGSTGIQDVVDELEDLEEYLTTEHGWTFGGDFARSGTLELEAGEQVQIDSTAYDEEDEAGEYAPQIVDLTPEQARLLGVTAADVRDASLHLGQTSLQDKVPNVVQSSGEEEEEEDEDGEDGHGKSDEESEEEVDLEEMDARY